jgi:ribokinase
MPRWDDPGTLGGFALADGGPAGTACAVAATLGARTGFVDTVGNDEMAAMKLRSLVKAGVDISRMVKREAPENHVVVVYVQEQTGERYFSLLRGFLSQPVQPEELDRDYLTSARYLHLDGFHPKAALQAARWMHEAGKTAVLDAAATDRPVPEGMRALVAETDVLICGSGFGAMLTGHEDPWQSGRAVLDMGPRIVVQTEGTEGSYTVSPDDQFHTPAFEVDVVDTTGAGDVFHGAYLVGLVRGWDLRRTATFASAVSAIHCTVLGNRKGIPSMEEVDAFLRERG